MAPCDTELVRQAETNVTQGVDDNIPEFFHKFKAIGKNIYMYSTGVMLFYITLQIPDLFFCVCNINERSVNCIINFIIKLIFFIMIYLSTSENGII